MKVKKAIIPVAGLGTRFLPATKAQPKEMIPIVDKPALQFIIEEAVASGIEEILLITGRNKRSIEDHFDRSVELEMMLEKSGKQALVKEMRAIADLANIHYIRQKEPKGLGHAIGCARSFIGQEPFAVLLGDDVVRNDQDPCLGQMIRQFEACQASVLGVQQVPLEQVHRYGIVRGQQVGERRYRVEDLVEKPSQAEAPSNVAILGRYIITPAIFEILERTAPGKGGEIQLTDALRALIGQEPMYAYDFIGKRYDIGEKQGYLEATVEYALSRPDLQESFAAYLQGLDVRALAARDGEQSHAR